MVSLIAKKDIRYASRDLRAGEAFTATEKDAQVLKTVGHAEDAMPDDDPGNAEPKHHRKSRKYHRRDLLSESEGDA